MAARLSVALYNEGGASAHAMRVFEGAWQQCANTHSRTCTQTNGRAVARLELVQADAATFVEEALSLLPYAEEGFQVCECIVCM